MEYQNKKEIIQDSLELPIVFLSKERTPSSLLEGIFSSGFGREKIMGKSSNSPRIQVKQNLNEESFSHQETKIDWSKYDKWNQPAREREEKERERLERESREELEQGFFGHYSFSMTR